MGRSFLEIIVSNFLIVLALIPMVILLNSIIAYESSPIIWIIISSIALIILSYLSWRHENGS